VAVALAKAGQITEALRVVQTIEHAYRNGAFRSIAEVQANAGKIPDALRVAEMIEVEWMRAAALGMIAVVVPN
jgi:hypothetical protein